MTKGRPSRTLGTDLSLSIAIVSHHRPQALQRCLMALRFQDHPCFEVILVADTEGVHIASKLMQETNIRLKLIPFETANISAARNLALEHAAGELIAFIDDDAVAEPTWASRLTAPFAQEPRVLAATGFVRGRNGLSLQWGAVEVDTFGQDHALALPLALNGLYCGLAGGLDGSQKPDFVLCRPSTAERAIKTVGTNCAFRRQSLVDIKGFDDNFRFYLDETDVNMRLQQAFPDMLTAIIPGAQVVHGFLASSQRRANRAPLSLFDIGASSAVFARKHTGTDTIEQFYRRARRHQHRRLWRFVLKAKLGPHHVGTLLNSFDRGWQDGLTRCTDRHDDAPPLPRPAHPFIVFQDHDIRKNDLIFGTHKRHITAARQRAERAAKFGHPVTLIVLSCGLRRHHYGFCDDGYWIQSGGVWGKAERDRPAPLGLSFPKRFLQEARRIKTTRTKNTHSYE